MSIQGTWLCGLHSERLSLHLPCLILCCGQEGGRWQVSGGYVGHEASVEDLQWSPTEETVFASCSVDKTLMVWDTRERSKPMLTVQVVNQQCFVFGLQHDDSYEWTIVQAKQSYKSSAWGAQQGNAASLWSLCR